MRRTIIMEKISKKHVEEIFRNTDGCKRIQGIDNESLSNVLDKAMENFRSYLSSLSVYEMAQAINSITHFLEEKESPKEKEEFMRGDIVIIDYGFMNFGYEFSFPHPSVVLCVMKNFIMVAPCTTKKFGRGYSDVLDAYKDDGFEENTGIILDQVRWVSSYRAISKIGTTSFRVLRKIEEFTLNHILTYTFEKTKKRKEMVRLIEENDTLRKENERLKNVSQR